MNGPESWFTTAQATEMLNVSQPQVLKLLDQGELALHMTGTTQRIAFAELLAFRDRRDQQRRDALGEIHQIADETGMDL